MDSIIQKIQENNSTNKDVNDDKIKKCLEWLEKTSINEDVESICTDTTDTTESSSFSTFSKDLNENGDILQCYIGNKEVFLNDEVSNLETIITQNQNVYTNVQIKKSKNVHLGNITYINGPVYINQTSTMVNQHTVINQFLHQNGEENENESKPPKIINRTFWLAQPPTEAYEYLENPAKYVIICHSATEEAFTQPQNILLVRLIQQFHIESRNFDDIGYNFLIGADGNIYEGRGWNVIGAHTYVYNKISIGICFIGCFTTKLPSASAIKKAKRLISYGVQLGYIDKDYSLVGHCQCTTTESPGRKLFEELKTWDRFDDGAIVGMPLNF